jgi:hypothetical protein
VLSSSYFIVAVSLFFDAFSVTRLYSVHDRVISKYQVIKRIWQEAVVA